MSIHAPVAHEMCFSNDGSSWSDWEGYSTSKSWTLSAGTGTKTVSVKIRDSDGTAYMQFQDSRGNILETQVSY